MFIPQHLITTIEYDVMPLAGPMVEIPQSKPQPLRPRPVPQPVEAPRHIPKLIAPRFVPPQAPATVQRPAEVPKVEQAEAVPNLSVPESGPVRPIEVKTGVLGDSPAAGGFGDPHGLPGAADPSKRVNIAHIGAFDNDAGPGYGSGNGNGTGVGGAGGRGNGNGVISAGFGGGSAFATGKSDRPKAVEKSGFQSAEVVPQVAAKPKAAAPEVPAATPVAILDKPNPQYTDEARRLGIEGEVLVDVVFLGSGQVKVEKVAKGLGHGLDEAAIRAAEQIRFRPAMQDGHAVDFPATVHIVFQLAF
jgi:TonB family protein